MTRRYIKDGFQPDAFQTDAFQVDVSAAAVAATLPALFGSASGNVVETGDVTGTAAGMLPSLFGSATGSEIVIRRCSSRFELVRPVIGYAHAELPELFASATGRYDDFSDEELLAIIAIIAA